MNYIAEVKHIIHTGAVVACFLQNTKRNHQAIALCKECLVLLDNLTLAIENHFAKLYYRNIYAVMFWAYCDISDNVNAEICARKLLTRLQDLGDRRQKVIVSFKLADIYYRQRRFAEAKELFQSGLEITKAVGDRGCEGIACYSLGCVLRSIGETKKAVERYKEALAIMIEIGDRRGEASACNELGPLLQLLGEYQKAKECHEKVLSFAIEIGDRQGEAATSNKLGALLQLLGEYQKAKECHEKALSFAIEIGDRQGEASACDKLGTLFRSLGEYQKAKEYLEKAISLAIKIGDRKIEAAACNNLGNLLHSLGEYQKAKEYLEKALSFAIEIGHRQGEAASSNNLGTLLHTLAEHQKAKEHFEKVLSIVIEIGDRGGEAATSRNLGALLQSLGEYQEAKEYHEKALSIMIEIGNREGEAATSRSLGTLLQSLGEHQKAKECYEKALSIVIEIGDREGEAANCQKLGALLQSRGEYQEAKEYHEKALAIVIEIGNRRREANIYNNLGNLFHSLGEYREAKEYYEKALPITKEIGFREGEAETYQSLGALFFSLGKYKQAKENLEKAIAICRKFGYKKVEGCAYHALGIVFLKFNDRQSAKEYFEKALGLSIRTGDKENEAHAYTDIGTIFLELGEYGKAEEYFEKARFISCDIGDTSLQLLTLVWLSRLKLQQSKFQEGHSYLREAIQKYEKLRNSLHGKEQFQVSLLEVKGTHLYKSLSKLICLKTGNPGDAIYVEELGRARCLGEQMAAKLSVENHVSAEPRSWSKVDKISNKERHSTVLYVSYYERKVHIWVLKPNGDTLFRCSQWVDDKTLIAEKAFNLNSFFNKGLRGFGILPRQKCEDRSLSETVLISPDDESETNLRGEETPETERRLNLCSKLIIAPVADLLSDPEIISNPEIIIVPERSLYRVPFAALRQQPGGKYLSETFRIRIVPSLTTLKLIQDCPADYHCQTGALVVGNPKAGTVHYKGKTPTLVDLPGARKEAEMIGRLLGVQPLLGERATRDAVLQAINSASLIHIAAHGNADTGEIALSPRPTAKSIPEEEDYLLRISDILQVQLRAKLVVLSCCHSGRGEIKAEGVLGIARAFLASGARSVLVTLWAIEDEATWQFMSRFYRHLVDGFSASECLHQAMKWLRNTGFTKVSQWAPFMLIGDNVTFDFKKERLGICLTDNNQNV